MLASLISNHPSFWNKFAVEVFSSVKLRVSVLLAIIMISLALIISAFVGRVSIHQLESEIANALQQTAAQMIYQLDTSMFERYREMQIISDLIVSPDVTDEQKQSLLNTLQDTYENYSWIGITDTNGIVQLSTDDVLEGVDVSARPWFQQGRDKVFLGDRHEAVLLAEILYKDQELPVYFVDIAYPLMNEEGKLIGVLGAHINWSWVEGIKDQIVSQDGAEVLIVDQNGEILADPGQNVPLNDLPSQLISRIDTEQSGETVAPMEGQRDYVVGFAKSEGYLNYPGFGWSVLVREPLDIAFQPAYLLERQIFLIGLAATGVFMVIGWFITGRLVQPLIAISSAANRIQKGELDIAIPVVKGRDEVATLSIALNGLVRNLTQQIKARKHSEARADNLEVVLEQERELIRMREGFISVVSHEFRTPLAVIVSSISLLTQYYERLTAEKRFDHIQRIQQQTYYMLEMLDDMLLYSRARAGKLEYTPVMLDFVEVCRKIFEEAVRLDGGKHEYKFNVNNHIGVLRTDAKLLQHILANLLSNAAKYSAEKTLIRVEISRKDEQIVLQVIDQGIGIPKQDLPKLFEPFHRARNAKDFKGTGLGLSIVRESVHAQGGTIEADSIEGVGTSFTVKLPLYGSQLPSNTR
jgi:signal transduction histidine kinase